MKIWAWLWNLAYLGRSSPWDIGGPRPELVRLVESGEIKPGKAIDLGCGLGENAIYLAQQGFDITGIDISPLGISKAQIRAEKAGVSPTLLVGDVTDLAEIDGPFDLVVDNGCLHSLLNSAARQSYIQTLLRLIQPGSQYFLRCFVKNKNLRYGLSSGLMKPGEVERYFSGEFDIKSIPVELNGALPLTVDSAFLLTKR